MDRYKLTLYKMQLAADGEWVDYADVKKLDKEIDALKAQVAAMTIDKTPRPEQIKNFLAVFVRLSNYEAQQRTIRSYNGVFTPDEVAAFPIPSVVEVCEWLLLLAGQATPDHA